MKITKEFYTGPFANCSRKNEKGEFILDEYPMDSEFLNPSYPYLNQLYQVAYCFGISLWKIEVAAEFSESLNPEKVHKLITSTDLLEFQRWRSNGKTGKISEKKAPEKETLVKFFTKELYYSQTQGNNGVKLQRKFCKKMATEFLESLEEKGGKIIHFFNIQYGWSDWFASDCYDVGFLMTSEKAFWLLTFSESD